MSGHNINGPSVFARRMVCPGSAVLEADEPDTNSKSAALGTLAHALRAHCLLNNLDATKILFLDVDGVSQVIPQDMAETVQESVADSQRRNAGHHVFIEQAVSLESILGEKDATGTLDEGVFHRSGKTAEITDYKHGLGHKVWAANNSQLMIYAIEMLEQFDMVFPDVEKVILRIDQRRLEHIDEVTVTREELEAFKQKALKTMVQVRKAQKSNSLEGFLNPGDEQCLFCKAKAKCPALARQIVEATAADFDDVSQTELVEPIDPHKALLKVEIIEQWCRGIRSKVESDLLSGKTSRWWKLVEGKLSNRAWVDEDTVIKRARELGASDEDIINTDVRSPAQIEKKLKKQPKIWTQMQKLLKERKPGPPSVAPISDPRSEYKPDPTAEYEDVS